MKCTHLSIELTPAILHADTQRGCCGPCGWWVRFAYGWRRGAVCLALYCAYALGHALCSTLFCPLVCGMADDRMVDPYTHSPCLPYTDHVHHMDLTHVLTRPHVCVACLPYPPYLTYSPQSPDSQAYNADFSLGSPDPSCCCLPGPCPTYWL